MSLTKRQHELLRMIDDLDPQGHADLFAVWAAGPTVYSSGPAKSLEMLNFDRMLDGLKRRGFIVADDDGIMLTDAGKRAITVAGDGGGR